MASLHSPSRLYGYSKLCKYLNKKTCQTDIDLKCNQQKLTKILHFAKLVTIIHEFIQSHLCVFVQSAYPPAVAVIFSGGPSCVLVINVFKITTLFPPQFSHEFRLEKTIQRHRLLFFNISEYKLITGLHVLNI